MTTSDLQEILFHNHLTKVIRITTACGMLVNLGDDIDHFQILRVKTWVRTLLGRGKPTKIETL